MGIQQDSLTAIANAIRAKTGGTELIKAAHFAAAIAGIPTTGGDSTLLDSIVNRSVTEINNMWTNVGANTFSGCTKLISVDLSACLSVSNSAFQDCTLLTSVELPACTSVGRGAFTNCAALTSINLPVCTFLEAVSFSSCTSLIALILGTNTKCKLNNKTAFNNTPIAQGTGYIYVPAALVDEYKDDTNWSYYADQIRAIEDYPEIVGGESE